MFLLTGSAGFEDALYRADQPVELAPLVPKAFPPGGRQRVVAGPPVVLRRAPLRLYPAVDEQALKRRIERALADLKDVLGYLAKTLGDAVPVQLPPQQRAEDQHVERARQKIRWLIG